MISTHRPEREMSESVLVMKTGKFPLKSYLINYKSTPGPNSVLFSSVLSLPYAVFLWMSARQRCCFDFAFHFLPHLTAVFFSHFPISFAFLSHHPPFTPDQIISTAVIERSGMNVKTFQNSIHTFASLFSWCLRRLRMEQLILAEKETSETSFFFGKIDLKLKENR